MMRYQSIGVTPDPLPLPPATAAAASSSSSHLRTCKEEGLNGNAKIPNFPASEPKPLLPRPASVPSASRDQAFAHLPRSSPEPTGPAGGDVLLQWGRRKRSRGARAAESRAANGEETGGSGWRQPAKIQRRSISGMEKPPLAAAAVAAGAAYSRGANLRACSSSRDSSGFLLTRNAEDRPNGSSRPEKRAPPSPPPERPRRANGSSTLQADPVSRASTPSAEQEAAAAGSGAAAGHGAPGPSTAAGKLDLDKFEWPRIYLTLSRKEKEEDFFAMKGTKLPHRPKKRAKNVDKALQYCFPGMWLSDLTRGRYEVREKKCVRKKRRGLKGLESMDSDSD